ncbi:PAS sensor protein [Planctopirus limnophila DSM 3776]|uniref:histidine kinase n=1 Tax=Planctopirus limnophila (strain ATCC 43296 / DSM 3776 / IFAM 1008 / Mu 290) TaxID=521674 RepID=D5SN45_PLAL2|nr:PAS domain S-box protein [Planctopirus limnophila]ADG65972.1 PAS sensor protein [Planctopirus limnophila DSM 3776]
MTANLDREDVRNSAPSLPLLDLLAAVSEASLDALFVKDSSGRYLFCNAAGTKLTNRTREQILDQDDTAVFGSDTARIMRAQDQRVMQSGLPAAETHVVQIGDNLRSIQMTTKPYQDQHGTVQGVIVIARDFADAAMGNRSHTVGVAAANHLERSGAEQALRESERQLADAQRIARIGSWVWEPSSGKVWWSRGVFALFGVDPQVVQPSFQAFLQLLHPDDLPTAVARVDAMLAGADRFEDDLRIIRPDGQMIWLHSRAVATRDADGNILRVEGTDQDITARKLAAAEVQASQKFVKAVAETSPLTIYVFDLQQQSITYSNYYLMRDLGFTPEAIQGRSWAELAELVHPIDFANVTTLLQRWDTVDDQQVLLAEYRLQDVHGNWRWFVSRDRVFERTPDGRVSQIIGTAEDITERKRVEQSLRESEQRFRELADAIPQIVWVAALDGGLTYLNAKATEYTGVGMDQLTGWSWEQVIHPEDVPNAIERWTATLEQELPRDIELRIRQTDGAYRWHISRQVPIRDASGAIVRWYGTCTDIDDLKRTQAALQQSESTLEEAMRIGDMGSWIIDLVQNRATWSDEGFRLLGYVPGVDQPSQELFLNGVYPADRDTVRHDLANAIATQTSLNSEFRFVRPDGQLRWLHSRARATSDQHGRPIQFVGVTQDITARKQAELARLEVEERYRLAILATNDLIWDLDPVAGTVAWSEQYAATLGRTPESSDSLQWWIDRIHPADRERTARSLSAAVDGTATYWTADYEFLRADGVWASIHDRAYIARDAAGHARRVVGAMQDVTDRKRAETEVRRTAELLRAVAEGTSDAVFVKDRDGKYLLANQAACQFMGKPLEQVLGRDDSEWFDAEGARLVLEVDREVMRSGLVRTSEETLTANYVTRTYLASKAPYRDELGNVIGIIGISRDITARKEAERMLRLNQFSVDHAVDSIFWINASSEILYVNNAACRTLGYTRDEMLGKTVPDIDPNFLPEAWPAHWEELRCRGSFTFESDHVTKDGRTLKTEVTVNYLQYEGQEYNCAIMRDISERKQAELEMRQSLSRMRATLESTADGILVVDLEGRVLDYNRRFISIWRFPEEMIAEANKSDIIASSDQHQAVQKMLAQLKDPEGFVRRVQEMYQNREESSFDVLEFKDGRIVERFSQPQWMDGQPVGRVLSFRDVSEQRKLEEQLRQSQKMEAVGQFAGGIAHDFNNLLTVINCYCELLLDQKSQPQNWRESVQHIRDEGLRAAQLTKQLLDFSRRSHFQPRVIHLNDVIEGSQKLLRRLIGERIQLILHLDPLLPAIKADTTHLDQVLMNLVVNARDAMPAGGRLTIRTSRLSPQDARQFLTNISLETPYVQLEVADTGIGMSADVQARIFEPFFTTKEIGSGSGLGLAVVHGIMQQHDGQIHVTTEPGVGTTFRLLFPGVAEEPPSVTASKQPTIRHGAETILLVEDEPAVRKATRLMLELQGYRVLEAANGREALDLVRTLPDPIDLLITDVVMPGIGGRELAGELRSMHADLPVVYISGYSESFGARGASLQPHEAFLQKPFTQADLLQQVYTSIVRAL